MDIAAVIVGRYKIILFYSFTGENFDPEDAKSSPLIGVWNPDGMGMTLYMIKLGLEEEKFVST